ncbi:MAG: 3'-5' exoribonuclease [Prevotellaceae bacterium]|jgi:DNA polymerase-3 subunit epsilon|nr:3'-5' exoribonuclease [Prevotellaceae bacterium]
MNELNFVAIDFETATEQRSSVCEIGLAFVENGEITDRRSWLVKPKNNNYCLFNISIHGITPEQTANSPEFNTVWEEIRLLIDGKTVVAHNAAFDMYVLRDTLDLYDLEYPNINTFCSCTLAKRTFLGLISYSLSPLCNYLGIALNNHHRAEDDACACAEACLKCFEKSSITDLSMLTDTYRIIMGTMNNGIYTGPKTKRDYSDKLDAKDIKGDISKHKPDNLFYGKSVVFTGTLTSMKRADAMQIVADSGGIPEDDITTRTNFLVVGQQNFRCIGQNSGCF